MSAARGRLTFVLLVMLAPACGGYTEQAMNVERAHSAQLSAALDAVAVQTTQYQAALAKARAELAELQAHCATVGATLVPQ